MFLPRRAEQHKLIECSFCSTLNYINKTLVNQKVQKFYSRWADQQCLKNENFSPNKFCIRTFEYSNIFHIKQKLTPFRVMSEQIKQQLRTQAVPADKF